MVQEYEQGNALVDHKLVLLVGALELLKLLLLQQEFSVERDAFHKIHLVDKRQQQARKIVIANVICNKKNDDPVTDADINWAPFFITVGPPGTRSLPSLRSTTTITR